ncbi:transmembrane protein, putative (macronuclear) [Tetrahymena thermophila SB210]|uniref:Transmembrane protein, putative n=1 Tax=Tetrahymena thermophila (strain SB210) TaxID=312017 RepID=W7XFB1_TETTS|nr:transmembrane protein, putative [Tetrahymena thermophila SB210]EWS76497.1 transmembrane protein, putative [Tetrahymena thermophila SB210]|eukprot:XP_012650968.1 transmembrane protein, putative [Tetrahymena thermophila SB210]
MKNGVQQQQKQENNMHASHVFVFGEIFISLTLAFQQFLQQKYVGLVYPFRSVARIDQNLKELSQNIESILQNRKRSYYFQAELYQVFQRMNQFSFYCNFLIIFFNLQEEQKKEDYIKKLKVRYFKKQKRQIQNKQKIFLYLKNKLFSFQPNHIFNLFVLLFYFSFYKLQFMFFIQLELLIRMEISFCCLLSCIIFF